MSARTAISSLLMDYMSELLACRSIENAWELHVGRMDEYGFDRLIYGANRFRSQGEFGDISDAIVLTNHDEEYIDIFIGKGLYVHGPMAIWGANNTGCCSWQWAQDRRKAGECSENECRVLDMNARMGINAGYTISFDTISERSKSAIGLCAKRGLSQSEINTLWASKGDEILLLNKLMNQTVGSLPFERQGKPLTKRQREVLQWVADGKTLQDIATIMELSQATIEKHLRLARNNLGADTTAQAVLKASVQGQFFLFEGLQNQPVTKQNRHDEGTTAQR